MKNSIAAARAEGTEPRDQQAELSTCRYCGEQVSALSEWNLCERCERHVGATGRVLLRHRLRPHSNA